MTKRITVEPPSSDTRRDRVERQLFTQLANVRLADRADAVVPAPRRSRGWLFAGAAVALAAVAVISFGAFGLSGEPSAPQVADHQWPSRVVTPAGGTSTFMVNDAVIVAASDTSVDVQRASDGGTTLVVARGAIDCDVAPRNGRPPFHVIAGDVAVEVVGTRFTVTRTPSPRVDVARGKVRVTAPGGTWLVATGESWSPQVTASTSASTSAEGEPVPTAEPVPTPAPAPAPTAPPRAQPTVVASLQTAERMLSTDPSRAAKLLRAIANGRDSNAALALVDLASVLEKTDPNEALRTCDEYLRRFPHTSNTEDMTWSRITILRSAGRRDEARAAAGEYLRQFPKGSYAGIAARIASP